MKKTWLQAAVAQAKGFTLVPSGVRWDLRPLQSHWILLESSKLIVHILWRCTGSGGMVPIPLEQSQLCWLTWERRRAELSSSSTCSCGGFVPIPEAVLLRGLVLPQQLSLPARQRQLIAALLPLYQVKSLTYAGTCSILPFPTCFQVIPGRLFPP